MLIISGFPRSGTSLMMSILASSGGKLFIDGVRAPDIHNPRGYFEHESMRYFPQCGLSILDEIGDRAVKMMPFQLSYLPVNRKYTVIFMTRDLKEIVASKERFGPVPFDFENTLVKQLDIFDKTIGSRPGFKILRLSYWDLLHNPENSAEKLNEFLGFPAVSSEAFFKTVDFSLYRCRNCPAPLTEQAESGILNCSNPHLLNQST
jgi:hypothetical protein